jgi:hypothetical protein
MSSNR